MTALKQYEKLEAPGLWRENTASQRREVYVSFGDTSLVVRNHKEEVLSHWSLPAVHRLNPGQKPAIYSPNPEARETLEIEDSVMIAAIEEVRAAIDRRRPHPGRLRFGILVAISIVIILLAIFWLPGALERHTVRVVPFETRQQIGKQVLEHITRLTGKACTTQLGSRALARLETRLLSNPRAQIIVLGDGIAKSAHLPGGYILLNKVLVEDHELAEVAAGYVLLEQLRADTHDPLARMLQLVGGIETFRLLTTGRLSDQVLRDYAEVVLTATPAMAENATLISRFETAGFASSPLAYAIDLSGETTLTLIEADPFGNRPYAPLLSDSDWVSLQAICGG